MPVSRNRWRKPLPSRVHSLLYCRSIGRLYSKCFPQNSNNNRPVDWYQWNLYLFYTIGENFHNSFTSYQMSSHRNKWHYYRDLQKSVGSLVRWHLSTTSSVCCRSPELYDTSYLFVLNAKLEIMAITMAITMSSAKYFNYSSSLRNPNNIQRIQV